MAPLAAWNPIYLNPLITQFLKIERNADIGVFLETLSKSVLNVESHQLTTLFSIMILVTGIK